MIAQTLAQIKLKPQQKITRLYKAPKALIPLPFKPEPFGR